VSRAAAIICLVACGSSDLSVGNERVGPPPFEVIDVSISEGETDVPLNQPFTIWFNRYLDAEVFRYSNAVKVCSSGVRGRGFSRYRMADRSVTFFPTRNLRSRLIYNLGLNDETVLALGGENLSTQFERAFQTAEGGTVVQDREIATVSYAGSVFPLFEQGCGCHVDDDAVPSLDYESLMQATSTQMDDRLLVVPYDPTTSYLMQKILPDYPDRRLSEMPPAWGRRPPLTFEQLSTVENWILTGANP
jgi:hypothetical protein